MAKIQFEWKNGGTKVMFACSYSGWIPTEMQYHEDSKKFMIEVTLGGGIHYYKFIVDGTWLHDETVKTRNDGYGGKNNTIEVQKIYPLDDRDVLLYRSNPPDSLIECPVCLYTGGPIYQLHCSHTYCVYCLQSRFENHIDNGEHEIRCSKLMCDKIISHAAINNIIGKSYRYKLEKNIQRHKVNSSDDLIFCPNCGLVCKKYNYTIETTCDKWIIVFVLNVY